MFSILSMNFFIIVSTLFKNVLFLNIDSGYYIFIVSTGVITTFYALYIILKKQEITMSLILLLLIITIVTCSFTLSIHKGEELASNNFIFFIMWAIPAAICGIYIRYLKKDRVLKFFKSIFFIFSISIILIILVPYILGSLPAYINFGLMNYQNVSYISAFTIGIGLYFITEKYTRFKLLYIFLIGLLIPVIFISGGRGGAVLLIIYILTTILMTLKNQNVPFFKKLMINTMVLVFSVFAIFFVIKSGNTRTFSYISNGKISLEGTSGRGEIYSTVISLIEDKPLTGYGLFNYYHFIHTIPHNIVLEILLAFGIVGLFVISIFMFVILYHFIKNYDSNSLDRIVIFIGLYPITYLMFSANFLIVSELWFVLFYMISNRKKVDGYGKKELYKR